MIRAVVRAFASLVVGLSVFWACYSLLAGTGLTGDHSAVLSMLATAPWAYALGRWAALPPRVEPSYFAPLSTQVPTNLEDPE